MSRFHAPKGASPLPAPSLPVGKIALALDVPFQQSVRSTYVFFRFDGNAAGALAYRPCNSRETCEILDDFGALYRVHDAMKR